MSVSIGDERRHFGAAVQIVDPGREISFDSQWDDSWHWTLPTFWTIRLTSHYGATMVETFPHGFERPGTGAADNLHDYERGWDIKHLNALRALGES